MKKKQHNLELWSILFALLVWPCFAMAQNDVTYVYITNPQPVSNANGWTIEGMVNQFRPELKTAEFWNQSGASIYQTISLPAGNYRLTATAFTRTGMKATLFANENKMNIATVSSSTVNSLSQASYWLDSGGGINYLDFVLTEAKDVTIGLKADQSTSDYWLVWRGFQLQADSVQNLTGLYVNSSGYGDVNIYSTTVREEKDTIYVVEHSSLAVNITPDNGCYISNVSVNGIDMTNQVKDGVLVLEDVSPETTIYVTFAIRDLNILPGREVTDECLINPTFDDNINGWNIRFVNSLTAPNAGYQNNTVYTNDGSSVSSGGSAVNDDGKVSSLNNFIEVWNPSTSSPYRIGDCEISQTIYGLPAGKYKLSCDAIAVQQGSQYQNPIKGTSLFIRTNTGYEEKKDVATANNNPEHFTLEFTYPSNANVLILGLKTEKSTANWIAADNFRLYYLEAEGYTISYIIDDQIVHTDTIVSGKVINPFVPEERDGYIFNGWNNLPDTMPDHDITVTGSFAKNVLSFEINQDSPFVLEQDVKFANVTVNVDFKAGFNSLVLPFTLSETIVKDVFGDDAKIFTFGEIHEGLDTVRIIFKPKEEQTIEANEPVLIKTSQAINSFEVNEVSLLKGTAAVNGIHFAFVGNYNGTTLLESDTYYLSTISEDIYSFNKSTGSATINSLGSYIRPISSEARNKTVHFIIDEDGTNYANYYQLKYLIDGNIWRSELNAVGSDVEPLSETPEKEGYSFIGWDNIPSTMPANNENVTAQFNINYYEIIYIVDGEVVKKDSIAYNYEITPYSVTVPSGFQFSGWNNLPETMPAKDITLTGSISLADNSGLPWDAPVYPSPEIEAGQTYYIYNVGCRQFVTGANLWAEQISLSTDGKPYMKVIVESAITSDTKENGYRFKVDGIYQFSGHFGDSWEGDGTGTLSRQNGNCYLYRATEEDGYLDAYYRDGLYYYYDIADHVLTTDCIWLLKEEFPGYYQIHSSTNNGTYKNANIQYAFAESAGQRVKFNIRIAQVTNLQNLLWQFIPADENHALEVELFATRLELYNVLKEAYKNNVDYSNASLVYQDSTATKYNLQTAIQTLRNNIYNHLLAKGTPNSMSEVTSVLLINPDFTANIEGWIYDIKAENTGYIFHEYTNIDGTSLSGSAINDEGQLTNVNTFMEAFNANGALNDGSIYQTIQNLPVGSYKITCDAIANNQNNPDATIKGIQFFVKDKTNLDITSCDVATKNGSPEHYSLLFVNPQEQDVTIGMRVSDTKANWLAFDNIRLYYYGNALDTHLFTIDYVVDGETIHTESLHYGEHISIYQEPTKEGYSFSGWSDIPKTMPSTAVTVTGTFKANATYETEEAIFKYDEKQGGYQFAGIKDAETTEATVPKEVNGQPVVSVPENIFATDTQLQVLNWTANASVEASYFASPEEHGNLLVFVPSFKNITYEGNVIRLGTAENITLYDGRPMTNPKQFNAKHISITKEFSKRTLVGSTSGWETIVVPFDVDSITTEDGRLIAPFGSDALTNHHFWLAQMNAYTGFTHATSIRANVPYIISMPNSERYTEDFCISGKVTFHGTNVKVQPTSDAIRQNGPEFGLVPTYQTVAAADSVYVLNDTQFQADGIIWPAGSVFVRSIRAARPFEAYTYANASNGGHVKGYIPLDEMATGLQQVQNSECIMHNSADAIYDLIGRRIAKRKFSTVNSIKKGLYIKDGQKVLVK